MVPSVNRPTNPPWVLIIFVVRHLMPLWIPLIICQSLLRMRLLESLPGFDRRQVNAT
jgi:hypothetical protein